MSLQEHIRQLKWKLEKHTEMIIPFQQTGIN